MKNCDCELIEIMTKSHLNHKTINRDINHEMQLFKKPSKIDKKI